MHDELPTREEIAQLPPDGGPEFNRLIFESSPYLRQHARNPVDWYPWGEEAFARARAEDQPIFLSVGYSTCHWCHVMARESFENQATARVLNEHFIAIKVDREERPEIDEIYMIATQLLTGSGGWPMSVWLTPDGRPWYAGTYFPPSRAGGRPGFRELVRELAESWRDRREEVEAQANRLAEAVRGSARMREMAPVELSHVLARGAVEAFGDRFDPVDGGFSDAPKFPPHAALRLLLDYQRRTGEPDALEMAVTTLDAMARGGIHDHVGGGFHRYSTDERWLLPHFEKMLYDNGQLARAYAEAWWITRSPEHEQAARGICEWVLREMTSLEGGFFSALDADSEGIEGKFYLWTRAEIEEVLGESEGALFADIFKVRVAGNFRDEPTGEATGLNILHLGRRGLEHEELWPWVEQKKPVLRERRGQRVWPHRDEKVLAAWNGLMIDGLAAAGRLLDEARYVAAAARAAEFVLTQMRDDDGRLLRTWRNGEAKLAGYLDDYAFMAQGLLALHEATGEARWLDEARALTDGMLARFADERGGFFFTAEDGEELLARVKRPFDGATPSENGVAALVLVRLAEATGEARYLDAARRTLETFSAAMRNAPTATATLIVATEAYLELAEERGGERPATVQPDARVVRTPLTVEAFASRRIARPGDEVEVAVRIEIADGRHINSHEPLHDYLEPTELTLAAGEALELEEVRYPEGRRVTPALSDEAMSVYVGETWLLARLRVHDDAEGAAPIRLTLSAQACNEGACGRPERYALELPLRIVEDAPAGGRHEAVFARLRPE